MKSGYTANGRGSRAGDGVFCRPARIGGVGEGVVFLGKRLTGPFGPYNRGLLGIGEVEAETGPLGPSRYILDGDRGFNMTGEGVRDPPGTGVEMASLEVLRKARGGSGGGIWGGGATGGSNDVGDASRCSVDVDVRGPEEVEGVERI